MDALRMLAEVVLIAGSALHCAATGHDRVLTPDGHLCRRCLRPVA